MLGVILKGGIVYRVFAVALITGVLAGVLLGAIHQFTSVPLILEAETYETGSADGELGGAASTSHDHAAHDHAEAWAPADGTERTFYTYVNSVLAGIGFALLISAGYALQGTIDWRRGVLWGLGGFVAFHLAPAIGLPPELPGAAAAPLSERQWWWGLTVFLTAGGLALVAFAPSFFAKGLGIVLLALPHLIGAPQPTEHAGLAPAELERSFIYVSLAGNAVFWIVLGTLSGFLFGRSTRASAEDHAASLA